MSSIALALCCSALFQQQHPLQHQIHAHVYLRIGVPSNQQPLLPCCTEQRLARVSADFTSISTTGNMSSASAFTAPPGKGLVTGVNLEGEQLAAFAIDSRSTQA
jgi:hypothetical protein